MNKPQSSFGTTPIRRLMRLPEVCAARGGVSKSKMYQDIANGVYTKSILLGPKFSVWPEEEVAALNDAAIAGKTPDEIRDLVKRLEAARVAAGSAQR